MRLTSPQTALQLWAGALCAHLAVVLRLFRLAEGAAALIPVVSGHGRVACGASRGCHPWQEQGELQEHFRSNLHAERDLFCTFFADEDREWIGIPRIKPPGKFWAG